MSLFNRGNRGNRNNRGGGLGGIVQGVTNLAAAKINQATVSQQLQQQQQMPQQPQQQMPQPAPQPPAPQKPSMLEGAMAGLLGAGERLIDNVGKLITVPCPNCQTVGVSEEKCEKCGTQLPAAAAISGGRPAERPTNCVNCGATANNATCEYCGTINWHE